MLNLLSHPAPLTSIIGKGLRAGPIGIGQFRCLSFGSTILLHAAGRTPTPDFDPTRGNNNPTKALFSATTPHQNHYNRYTRYSTRSTNSQRRQLSKMAATKEYRLFCLENPLLGKSFSKEEKRMPDPSTALSTCC